MLVLQKGMMTNEKYYCSLKGFEEVEILEIEDESLRGLNDYSELIHYLPRLSELRIHSLPIITEKGKNNSTIVNGFQK
jgi:hypothetical protein